MELEGTSFKELALVFVSGLAFVFLANIGGIENSSGLSKTLETLGIAMAGYASLRLGGQTFTRFREKRMGKSIERLFRSSVKIVAPKKDPDELPLFIAADIEGCITPSNRAEVDLRKFQRLRAYCEFVKRNPEYPPIVIYSGRSQGYVELLAQALGMLDSPRGLPFVIENGSALYYPNDKKTVSLLDTQQLNAIQRASSLLIEALPGNEFEPKYYMVTVNFRKGQTVDELRDEVKDLLRHNQMLDSLTVTSTASAVDVTVLGIDKLSGLEKVLGLHGPGAAAPLERIVALGDHVSDISIVRNVGTAYCPADAHPEIRDLVKERNPDHVISLPPTDFVSAVVERECGLRLL
jgi:hydroxymethylpyrimidine pyrophosphatase-like HAD family hydrolase